MRIIIMIALLMTACGSQREVDATAATGVHPAGILVAVSPDFHGTLLRQRNWDFALCQRCHGEDFGGGTSGVSCTSCHPQGPTACATCHRDGPTSGAHRAHLAGAALDRPLTCDACHRVPARWDQPGHILDDHGDADPAPAEVVLGAEAARATPARTGPPRYDAASGTCQNVYCHGGGLGDAAAAHPAPAWTGGSSQAACGACHGAPPASHAQAACERCHPAAFVAGRATATHLDGAIQLGDGTGCTACHGSGDQPAPPRALDGSTLPAALGVGAHRSHLDAPSRLRGPIACAECHRVPATVDAAGHLDSELPAEVFPVGAGILARADGAAPTWNRGDATCGDVYCHGGGQRLARDAAPGRITAPVWTAVGRAQAACGRCHGLPPVDGVHAATLTIRDCTTCHRDVDGNGNILFTDLRDGPPGAETSEHIDGTVTLR